AITYFDQALQSGNDPRIQAAFREISPFLSKFTGKPAPPSYTPDMQPAFDQVRARIAMVDSQQPQRQGKVVGNNLVDPTTGAVIYQGPEVPVNAQIVEVSDGMGGK